jgi:hypothetical protein
MSSTETAWDEMSDDELDFHRGMAQGLGWEDFTDEVETERERRAEAEAKAERAAAKARAEAFAKTPKGRIAGMRKALAEAERDLAGMERTTSPNAHPDHAFDSNHDAVRYEKANEVARLKNAIETAERRLPFNGTDDGTLTAQGAAIEAEVADLRAKIATADEQLRTTGIADTSFTTQQTREALAAAESKLNSIRAEAEARKIDSRQQGIVADLAARKALRMRSEALDHWRARERELRSQLDASLKAGETEHFDVGALAEASKNAAEIAAYINRNAPVSKDEIARATEALHSDPNFRIRPDGSVEAIRL